ncbi:hypothetical protein FB45DRAFT_35549 [Roridomyces roridus]|uniref:Uncharacterized protein n=1 Tax=Roridomyces roridus TaxID=1738132 RepID=A0AAD7CL03_9AGAR|nr:hypothetical protein FB45DRAFT_35549 [Roridomyces roridus]
MSDPREEGQELLELTNGMDRPSAPAILGHHSSRNLTSSPPVFDPYQEYPLDGYDTLPMKQSTTAFGATDADEFENDPSAMAEKGPITYSPPQHFNIWILLPGFLTAVLCAGAASALLGWLILRRVVSVDDDLFRGALVAFEGHKGDVSRQGILAHLFGGTVQSNSATGSGATSENIMYGLAMSSVAAHLVSFTLPFTLSTFAYLLASMWMQAQTRGRISALPTPTQYGHLVGLCGSFGPVSVYDAGMYLSHGRKSRLPAPTALIAAFFAALVALMLTYLSSLADLWLHTTAKTFSYEFASPIVGSLLPMVGSSINLTACPGPSLFESDHDRNRIEDKLSNCQHREVGETIIWGNADLVNEGDAVLGNSSVFSQVQMIENRATLLPATLPSGAKNLVFNTFAMNATCSPLDCKRSFNMGNETYFLGCTQFQPPFTIYDEAPPHATSMLNQFDFSTNALIFQSKTVELSGIAPGGGSGGYASNASLNPVGVMVDLCYNQHTAAVNTPVDTSGWYTDQEEPTTYSENDPTSPEAVFYLGGCVLDVWNISISYTAPTDGSTTPSFTPAPGYAATRTDFNTTSALLGALDAAYSSVLAAHLATSLQGSTSISSDDFNHLLAGNVSQGILALAAPLTERIAAVQGEAVTSATVSRYPLAPLCVLLALIYGYSALALAVGVAACTLPSRIITERETAGGVYKPTGELDLVHSRLTKPRMCISDRFHDDLVPEESQRLGVGFTNGCNCRHKGSQEDQVFQRNPARRFKVDLVDNLDDI